MITHSAPNTNYLSSTFAFNALRGAQNFGILVDMEIGEVIRRIRKERGLTLEAVADLIDYDTGGLSRVERGQQSHTPEMIAKIASVFGVKVSTMYAIAEGAELPVSLELTPDQQQVLALWEWLSPEQQQALNDKMKAEAASNRAFYERMSAKVENPPASDKSFLISAAPKCRKKTGTGGNHG